jgi:hypothetical protein
VETPNERAALLAAIDRLDRCEHYRLQAGRLERENAALRRQVLDLGTFAQVGHHPQRPSYEITLAIADTVVKTRRERSYAMAHLLHKAISAVERNLPKIDDEPEEDDA